ncbi:hypothetical protein [Paramagnetospirillum marisnigri]|nr:hypothetical protein [Paramagnetospirillum marisnigri]
MKWFRSVVPSLPRDRDVDLTPKRALDNLFCDFVTGVSLETPKSIREITPHKAGIWEFKTLDLRVFGFFEKIDLFIATHGATYDETHIPHPKTGETLFTHSEFGAKSASVAKDLGTTIICSGKYDDVIR